MKISLVIPCYNEEAGLPQLARALLEVRQALEPIYQLELVFVDDGSTDGTQAEIQRYFGALPDVQIVVHGVNRGLGAALRTGFRHATGVWIATTDSDCTYDPHGLSEMVRLMELGADVVVASPYHPDGGVHNVPGYRLVLSHNLSRLYNAVLGGHIHTYTSLFRIYRADLVRTLEVESDGFRSMAELMVGALLRGAKVVEHPTVLSLRQYGTSKAVVARMIGQHSRFLARLLGRRLTGRLWPPAVERSHPSGELETARFRRVPEGEGLVAWNQRLNRSHGMSVLSDHPNPLIRWHERDRKRRILRRIRPRPGDVVVEVGCERGGLSAHLTRPCRYLVCVDIDADALTGVRERLTGRPSGFVVADAQALPLRDGCADISISAHTLERLPDPAAALAELSRITAPNGTVVINVPNDRWVLVLKRLIFGALRFSRSFRGISPELAPGHLWVFGPSLFRAISQGRVQLGHISFNAPFFTNMFAVARPLSRPVPGIPRGRRSAQ
jgi:dolichol-phosphate mannosyltransferase